MGKIAFVFAGQGAQYPGMGKELYASSPAAKKIFDLCEGLRPGTLAQCFSGTKEELSRTINTQPCLYALDLAAALALEERGIKADFAAGFSLGELAACAYAGMFGYDEGFVLTCKRAELMDSCANGDAGAMVAVLGLPSESVESLCSELKRAYPANYNCPGQTVVSVGIDELSALCERVKNSGGRAVRLPVSGAFHSPFVRKAAENYRKLLENYRFLPLKTPVFSNVTADFYSGDYKDLLSRQIKSPVLWQKTIENLHENGVDTFIEAGAGKVLSGLISKSLKDVTVLHVEDSISLNETISATKGAPSK
jgi:[acyl-carrier-protein] S-malonyltransferase